MNILTKISVVVLLVLVLFASGVFISASVIPDNWRQAALNQQLKAEEANTLAMNSMLAARNAQIQRDDLSKQLMALKSESAGTISDLTTRTNAAEGKVTELNLQISGFKDSYDSLQKNLTKAQNMYEDTTKLVTSLRTQVDEKNKESIALGKQINDLTGANGRYENYIRALEVTIQDQKEQILKMLEQKNQPIAGKTAEPSAGGSDVPKVDGQIEAVRGDIASINIGSAKGIKKGMRLTVYRNVRAGVEWLSHMDVTDVDLSESSGVIVDRKGEIKQGDQVTTNVKS